MWEWVWFPMPCGYLEQFKCALKILLLMEFLQLLHPYSGGGQTWKKHYYSYNNKRVNKFIKYACTDTVWHSSNFFVCSMLFLSDIWPGWLFAFWNSKLFWHHKCPFHQHFQYLGFQHNCCHLSGPISMTGFHSVKMCYHHWVATLAF